MRSDLGRRRDDFVRQNEICKNTGPCSCEVGPRGVVDHVRRCPWKHVPAVNWQGALKVQTLAQRAS